ncbi:MAG: Hsp20/alpha crystallin family protein [Nitrospirota bacterium]|nr:Hsp20/alpha crystallin family protein [Nitrospirota bacterium]
MKSLVRFDPFKMIGRWDPFEDLRSMQKEMDRVFTRFLGAGRQSGEMTGIMWDPAVESYVKEGKLILKAELPGIDLKDLDVTVTDRDLVLKGERRSEKSGQEKEYGYREISYGSFERHFLLPEGARVEELKATFTNGILEISVPVPALPEAKKITIESKEAGQIEAEPKLKKAA